MNPSLFDLVKLWVAEKYPNLVVQYWDHDTQIRISSDHIVPFHESCTNHSLVSIVNGMVFSYVPSGKGNSKINNRWDSFTCPLESPSFFDIVRGAIEEALNKKKEHELQKSRPS